MAEDVQVAAINERRQRYEQTMHVLRTRFNEQLHLPTAGKSALVERSSVVDQMITALWSESSFPPGVALVAVGGYGRHELFPYSDVDLMFLHDGRVAEKEIKQPIRLLNQHLWDSGLRVSPLSRTLAECERFNPDNVEFTLALFDSRFLAGDASLFAKLSGRSMPRLIAQSRKKIMARLAEVTRTRHRKYGDTLFHLEPNIKDCPGGLRDAHVFAWLTRLAKNQPAEAASGHVPDPSFVEAREFLLLVRTFLHLRQQRDDNTLDWHAQDEAAAASLGISPLHRAPLDAAYWMRLYFRHARSIDRNVARLLEEAAPLRPPLRVPGMAALRRLSAEPAQRGFELHQGTVVLAPATTEDPAEDPDVMLSLFAAIARTGARCSNDTEQRLERTLPLLSAHLEDGPALWRRLEQILTGRFAGQALRSMHALGILELVIPEFHGIDALVIRDAYHRYTVDEHTFVLIDILHSLISSTPPPNPTGLELWAGRFASLLRDLPHLGLLYLAALLHDTGKGHTVSDHAGESARMAQSVVQRLELDVYECGLVLSLIRNHLEMSAALRRDVFDVETVRSFAHKVLTPEALRMLTLFTYADIAAVHPDALTPWKAENLHRLYMATADYLDRNVDEERVEDATKNQLGDLIHRVSALLPGRQAELDHFLLGFPQRYLLTRGPEQLRGHFQMAAHLDQIPPHQSIQLDFRHSPEISELTLITRDRPMLFASMAGALAAWGMNIVTADAFSNAHAVVVDSFRFTDTFRTLEMNESEHERFIESVRRAMMDEMNREEHGELIGASPIETMLAARRRTRRKAPKVAVPTRIDFDNEASSHSTLLQVVALDTPGLLRALSLTLAAHACNIEVALVDTEGEMAIDVFYITRAHSKLSPEVQESLRRTLLEAITANAR